MPGNLREAVFRPPRPRAHHHTTGVAPSGRVGTLAAGRNGASAWDGPPKACCSVQKGALLSPVFLRLHVCVLLQVSDILCAPLAPQAAFSRRPARPLMASRSPVVARIEKGKFDQLSSAETELQKLALWDKV